MPEATPLQMMAALPVASLPPPSGDVLTSDQWTTLLSICDTFIPSIDAADAPNLNRTEAVNYLSESASSVPGFKESVYRTLGHYTPPDGLKGLSTSMYLLSTRAGSLILTGTTTPFHLQTFSSRHQVLLKWSKSYLPPLRAIFKATQGLSKQTWISLSPTLPKVIDFPEVPAHGARGQSFAFDFETPPDNSEPWILETDVVIVGSGCGAGVSAYNLAAAGHKVLVVEKGYHYPSSHYPMQACDSGVHLLENGGVIMSDSGSIAVLAGSTLGGGGTVNWSASLQPQSFVREEWAAEGLPFFTSPAFQSGLDRVCGHMGVAVPPEHNFANRVVLEGARRLGLSAKEVPQNSGGKAHKCGYCSDGCAAATKQGPSNRWLPDAAERGAKFVQGTEVREVLFEDRGGSKTAVGVRGVWTSQDRSTSPEIVVNAKRVIIACGTLQSPLLLMRSGIKNTHLGRNLHLHPTAFVAAVFPQEVRPWEGAILTSAITSLENLDGHGHGPKIEIIASTPSKFLAFLPWLGAADYKTMCAKMGNMIGMVPIQRDRDTGRVYADSVDGRCRIEYTVSMADWRGLVEGMVVAAKVARVMGAKEIMTLHPDVPRYVFAAKGEDDEAQFQAWTEEVRKVGQKSPEACTLGSAHQMGTCRMGADSRKGVVDAKGRVWGTEGLYVADASVFPSASGVNPMVTTMGIADWISRGVVEEMGRGGVVEGGLHAKP